MVKFDPSETADILREMWRDSVGRVLNLLDMRGVDHSQITVLIMREKRQQQALTNAIAMLDEVAKVQKG